MKKLAVILIALMMFAGSAFAAETYVDRARVIMARVKDNASPLDSKASGAIALKYADAFVMAYGQSLLTDENGDAVAIGDVSNEDKAKLYVNTLRKFHREVYLAGQVTAAVAATQTSTAATANSAVDADLGTDEA